MRKIIFLQSIALLCFFSTIYSQEIESGVTSKHHATNLSRNPKIYALVVGVSKYKDSSINSLKFSDDDAYRMYAFLKSCKGGCVDDDNISVLVDEAATRKNILQTMEKIFSNAGPDDLLWFYFSGHGNPGYFIPYDAQIKDSTTFLSHDDLKKVFKQYKTKYKIVFADACHSGSIFSFRKQNYSYSSTSNNNTNVLIFLSSMPNEYSQEDPSLRQGVFSYYLLKGLKGVADKNNDGLVSLEEIYVYVKANVLNFTNNSQTPFIEGNVSPNLILSKVK